jgi:2-amino-4-hydroxy-6-hydroxymethyldihydropteridine diphosphokinase
VKNVKLQKAYLGLGSNLGDKKANLDRAIELLNSSDGISVLKVSTYIDTAPVGFEEQPNFLNAAVEVETTLTPRKLLDAVLAIESIMGRKRTIRWGPRVIDIDILLYNDDNIEEAGLVVPHPRMMERRFVLEPLAEIAPELVLPDGRKASEAVKSE